MGEGDATFPPNITSLLFGMELGRLFCGSAFRREGFSATPAPKARTRRRSRFPRSGYRGGGSGIDCANAPVDPMSRLRNAKHNRLMISPPFADGSHRLIS